MWSDNETTNDYLNFQLLADTAAEIILQAKGQPISLGVSGNWGVGKSSMIRLIEKSLKKHTDKKIVFVDFNAWLYQGYDDARAALMDVIAQELTKQAGENKGNLDKVNAFIKKISWLRLARFAASGVAMAHGLPPIATITEFSELLLGNAEKAAEAVEKVVGGGLLRQSSDSPPKEIQALRKHFESILEEMGITLVVLVDDLDRCLPNTAVSTLEAMRLFLFLKNTAFIIAADDKMIRNSVRVHFGDLGDDEKDLVTNYFDKLIQIPLKVPPLGVQEVRTYMMLLYIEGSSMEQQQKDDLKIKILKQLSESWQGKRVDVNYVCSLIKDCPKALLSQLDTAERLSALMASNKEIAGNPRLIKRFLNTLAIRLAMARLHNVTVEESVLAKILLFERCAGDDAFKHFVASVNENPDGKPAYLKVYEEKAAHGEEISDLPKTWPTEFMSSWLALPPCLSDLDMRPALHVGRDNLQLTSSSDQLSSEGLDLFAALSKLTNASEIYSDAIKKLSPRECSLIMNKLLAIAGTVQEWGKEPILIGCLTLSKACPEQAPHLAAFLSKVPVQQLKAAIVPTIAGQTWATGVFAKWKIDPNLPSPVKKAIQNSEKGGD